MGHILSTRMAIALSNQKWSLVGAESILTLTKFLNRSHCMRSELKCETQLIKLQQHSELNRHSMRNIANDYEKGCKFLLQGVLAVVVQHSRILMKDTRLIGKIINLSQHFRILSVLIVTAIPSMCGGLRSWKSSQKTYPYKILQCGGRSGTIFVI